MPKNDIGGIYVSIAAAVDKQSFETGNKLVDDLGNSFNKLIGSARNAAVVTAMDFSPAESSAFKFAESLHITTEALDLWRATARIATGDAKALDSALSSIAGIQSRLQWDNSGIESFSKQLSKLGIGYDAIKDLSADEALEKILTAAQGQLTGDNTAKIAAAVEDLLGSGAKQVFIDIADSGLSVAEYKAQAKKTVLTNEEDNAKGRRFQKEVNTFNAEVDSIKKLFGDSMAGVLAEPLKELNEWIQAHGEEIKDAMAALAKAIEKVIGKTIDFIKDEDTQTVAGAAIDAGTNLVKGSGQIISGVLHGDGGQIVEGGKTVISAGIVEPTKKVLGVATESDWAQMTSEIQKRVEQERQDKYKDSNKIAKTFGQIQFDELSTDLQNLINEYRKSYNKTWLPSGVNQLWGHSKLQDGIIRPDGTVTQVAPDDWVIAARNLGDVAKAFVPDHKVQEEEAQEKLVPHFTEQPQDTDQWEPLNRTIAELSRFVPQNHTTVQNSSDYTINQTFNISGSNDIPQVLKQEAYRGTQEGLLELMNQSSRRLQLMSGTR